MKLESLAGETPVEILDVENGTLSFGRDTENAVVIDSDSVSRVHATVFEAQGSWLLRDLDSTNGTLVNGIRVQPGQLRLLRSGDLIQLANFPLRFSDAHVESEASEQLPATLLVFYDNHFESAFPLAVPGARFVIGGPEGHFFLESAGEEPQLEIVFSGTRLELNTFPDASPTMVNGMVVGGISSLADRDEVDIGPYKIIVNDPATATAAKQDRALAAIEAKRKSSDLQSIQAHAGDASRGWEWETDPAKRKMLTGRKFVFGTSPDDSEGGEGVTGTISMSRQEMNYHVGEVGAANRFSQSSARQRVVPDGDAAERRQVIFGFFVLLVIIGAVVYFVMS